jgi:hypothetical protein
MDFPFTWRDHSDDGYCLIELEGVAHIVKSDWEDGGWTIDGLSAFGCKGGTYVLKALRRHHPLYGPIKRWLSFGDMWVAIDRDWQQHQQNEVAEAV